MSTYPAYLNNVITRHTYLTKSANLPWLKVITGRSTENVPPVTRKHLWIKGNIDDIKPGKHLVMDRSINSRDSVKLGLYDYTSNEILKQTGQKCYVGWSKGLQNNIALREGKTYALVMDNHHYAAPYIITLFDSGIIGRQSRMLHIDMHDDLYKENTFRIDEYRKSRISGQEVRFINENTSICEWQTGPLFDSGIVDEKGWRWLQLDEGELDWRISGTQTAETRMESIDSISGQFDIVDIDIDVLLRAEMILYSDGEVPVMNGVIHPVIERRIYEMAYMASKAKVLTLATSPCFINQARAIIYVKELLRLFSSLQEADRISPS